jgi:hypothetical protein
VTDSTYTRASVHDIAARIRTWASDELKVDPYARPYSPPESTVDNLIKSVGCDGAFETLNRRWQESKQSMRNERDSDRWKEQQERERIVQARKVRDEHRHKSPPWDRLRAAFTAAQYVCEGATAKLEASVSGGVEHPSRVLAAADRPLPDVLLDKMEGLARECERLVDRARQRNFPEDQRSSLEDRLVRLAGMSPEQVARIDPEQGSPAKIKQRRLGMGLNPNTGGMLREVA